MHTQYQILGVGRLDAHPRGFGQAASLRRASPVCGGFQAAAAAFVENEIFMNFCCCLRQALTEYPWLTWNSLCTRLVLNSQRSIHLCLCLILKACANTGQHKVSQAPPYASGKGRSPQRKLTRAEGFSLCIFSSFCLAAHDWTQMRCLCRVNRVICHVPQNESSSGVYRMSLLFIHLSEACEPPCPPGQPPGPQAQAHPSAQPD